MGGARPGELEVLVLMSAMRLGPDEAYAVSIVRDIEERTGRLIRRGNVYTLLQRLESRGLVSTHIGPARAERGGKGRRLVSVEAAGVAAVREANAAMTAMARGLEAHLEPGP